jgi:hypothetical protein
MGDGGSPELSIFLVMTQSHCMRNAVDERCCDDERL